MTLRERTTKRGSVQGSNEPSRTTSGTSGKDVLPPGLDIMDGLEEAPLKILSIPTIEPNEDDVRVKDCTYIGSYNWVECETPTILVPGSPRRWRNRPLPFNVSPDTGVSRMDRDSDKLSHAILLPLIESVNEMNKSESDFDWASVDIITDRSNLRKLTRWVKAPGTLRDGLRIDLQLAGTKTVLMNRWKLFERFIGSTFRDNFEKASTDYPPGCEDSTSHRRIVTYVSRPFFVQFWANQCRQDLNGLKMVVRFEVDVAIPPFAKHISFRKGIDDITKMMSGASISPRTTDFSGGQLQIKEGGVHVPSTAVVELTTRSQTGIKHAGFDWKEAYPQLFFSQTAHHFLAIHQRGRFVNVQKHKLGSRELQAVEHDVQAELKKVRKVLDLIREVVIEHGSEGRISLICQGDGEIKFYKRTSNESCLPEQTLNLFKSI